jgi:hypothetical protein
LARGSILVRVFWAVLLAMAMWYGLILGQRCGGWHRHPAMMRADAIVLGLILLAVVLILQLPLWVAKKAFRWQLAGPNDGEDDAEARLLEDRQFGIRDMMIATFLFAVALSPLRQTLPPGNTEALRLRGEMVAMLVAVVLCNLLMTIPCIWGAFRSTKLFRDVFGWLIYCLVLTCIEIGGLCAVLGTPGTHLGEVIGVFFVLNVSQCAAVFGPLRILRSLGFRMVRHGAQPSSPSCAASPDRTYREPQPGIVTEQECQGTPSHAKTAPYPLVEISGD